MEFALPFAIFNLPEENMRPSDQMIESLIASLSDEASEKDRHLFKLALRQLVKIAKAEQVQAIEDDFDAVYKVLSLR